MYFTVSMTMGGSAALTERQFPTLAEAIKAVSATVDAHPEMVQGFDDLAVISDASDGTAVVALFRMGNEFLLARETTDARYADDLLAIEHERYDSDGDPYVVFGRWSV